MVLSLLALAVAVATFLYAGRTHGLAGRTLRQRLASLALATLASGVIARLLVALGTGDGLLAGLLVALLAACLWTAAAMIVSLAVERASRGGWLAIGGGALLAAIASLGQASPVPPALLLLPLTARTPWLRRDTGPALLTATFGASLLVLWYHAAAISGALPALPLLAAGVVRLGMACAVSYALVLLIKLAVRLPGRLFDLLKLRARLVVSYALIAGPLLLVAVFLVILALATIGSYRSTLLARLTVPDARLQWVASRIVEDPELAAILHSTADDRQERLDALVTRHLSEELGTRSLQPATAAERASAAAASGARQGTALTSDLVEGDVAEDGTPAERAMSRAMTVLAPRTPMAPPSGVFVLAGVEERADSTRSRAAAAPAALAPATARRLTDLLPPCPYDGFVLVDSLLYATLGVLHETDVDRCVVQVCRQVDRTALDAVAALTDVQFSCVFTDSLSYSLQSGDITIDVVSDPNELRFSTSGYARTEHGGFYLGVQALPAFRLAATERLHPAGGLLIVRTDWSQLLATITDTVRNPFNRAIVIVLVVIAALFLLVELIAIATGGTIARNIHRAVIRLTRGTRRLAQDDLDHRLEIERGDELGELGRAFNAMAEGLAERRRLIVEQQRLLSELHVAHEIQQRMLPSGLPDIAGLEVAGISEPSREVGGDGYDVLAWGDGRLAVTISDVAGKGVPAALLMSNLQASVRAHARRPAPIDQVMHELNQLISSSTEPGRFITFFLGVVEPHTARLTYVNAGHNPPILVRAGGRLERLADGGLLLGAFPEAEYEAGGTTLEPGDVLVLYTDGVVEARRAGDDAYFEEERLEALLGQGLGGLPAATIRDRIVGAVSEFAAGAEQADDITVVVLRYLGPGPTARTPATPATPATLPDAAGA